jgi:molybdate transport system regulatory protein
MNKRVTVGAENTAERRSTRSGKRSSKQPSNRTPARPKPKPKPHPELWIKLIVPGRGQIGPGKIELLRRVERERSISAAARSMGMSYRRAWLLIDELNRLFDAPVVETHVGGSGRGGANLTSFGTKLIGSYAEIVARSHRDCASLLRKLADGRE